MERKTKNKIAGIVMLVCAIAIIVCVLLIKANNQLDQIAVGSSATPVVQGSSTAPSIIISQTSVPPSGDYVNQEYGFSVNLASLLKDYSVGKSDATSPGAVAKYSVLVATSDKNFENKIDDRAVAIEFTIYDKTAWENLDKTSTRMTEIAKNDKYAYTYSTWESAPTDLTIITDKDLVKLIETFKLI